MNNVCWVYPLLKIQLHVCRFKGVRNDVGGSGS